MERNANYAAVKDVQSKPSEEEYADGMGHIAILTTNLLHLLCHVDQHWMTRLQLFPLIVLLQLLPTKSKVVVEVLQVWLSAKLSIMLKSRVEVSIGIKGRLESWLLSSISRQHFDRLWLSFLSLLHEHRWTMLRCCLIFIHLCHSDNSKYQKSPKLLDSQAVCKVG